MSEIEDLKKSVDAQTTKLSRAIAHQSENFEAALNRGMDKLVELEQRVEKLEKSDG